MTDVYQPIRDYAQKLLASYPGAALTDRNAYIAAVLGYAALQGSDEMMATRIACHIWDSTPYKVIPHAHLPPASIPAGAQSPTGILSDANLTLDLARRLRG